MCSACAGDYEDPDMTADVLIDREDEPECTHRQVKWDAARGLFLCAGVDGCGAQLDLPELAEALGCVAEGAR